MVIVITQVERVVALARVLMVEERRSGQLSGYILEAKPRGFPGRLDV